MDGRIKYKISQNNEKKSDLFRFSVAYSGKRMKNQEAGYEIISALKKDSDIIIELNSTLINLGETDKQTVLLRLLKELEQLGVEYKNKKTSVSARRAILSIPLESKKIEGFELYALIPNEVWCQPEFKTALPEVGARYYLLENGNEGNLNAFVDLSEEEKYRLCKMVVFDNSLLGNMGINTSGLAKSDLEDMLKG